MEDVNFVNETDLEKENKELWKDLRTRDPDSPEYDQRFKYAAETEKLILEHKRYEDQVYSGQEDLSYKTEKMNLEHEEKMAEIEQKNKESKRTLMGKVVVAAASIFGTVFAFIGGDILEKVGIIGNKDAMSSLGRYQRS